MRFRYYITDTYDGAVYGTNDEDKAIELSACADYFVVDAERGEWINIDQEGQEVKEW